MLTYKAAAPAVTSVSAGTSSASASWSRSLASLCTQHVQSSVWLHAYTTSAEDCSIYTCCIQMLMCKDVQHLCGASFNTAPDDFE